MMKKINCIANSAPARNHWQAGGQCTLNDAKSPFKRILDKKIRQLKKKK